MGHQKTGNVVPMLKQTPDGGTHDLLMRLTGW